MNAARALNRPRPLEVEGATYHLFELDGNDLADFEAFANTVLLAQFEALWKTGAQLSVEHLKYLTQVAADRTMRYFEIGSAEVLTIMLSWVGAREILYLAIRHGDKTFTREQARTLFGKLNAATINSLPQLVGLVSPDSSEDDSDPKAGSPLVPTPGDSATSPPGNEAPG
jgi:hypothetical protein